LGHLDRDPMKEGEDKMRSVLIAATALVALAGKVAHSQSLPPEFPEYGSAAACAGLAKLATKFGDVTARVCARDENEARDASQYLWPDLPSDVQDHCLNVVELSAPAHMKYQSLHNCLEEMAYDQHQYAGEIPLSIRKKWLDYDIKALKARHD
jgi:hypothetical protein